MIGTIAHWSNIGAEEGLTLSQFKECIEALPILALSRRSR